MTARWSPQFFLALLLCLLAVPSFAAGPSRNLTEGQVLRGRFVQERHLQGFNAPLRSEGSFTLAPGKGLIWRAEKPFAVTTVITAAGLVQDVGGAETLRLASARLPFLSRLYDMLSGALGGDWRGLETDFVVTRTGDDRLWSVRLTPRRGADPMTMPFQSITAEGGRFIEKIDLAKPGGDADSLIFRDQTLSAAPLAADEATALAAVGPG